MAVILAFPPVCRECCAKGSIVTRYKTDPFGKILQIEICEKCGILQSEPKPAEGLETI